MKNYFSLILALSFMFVLIGCNSHKSASDVSDFLIEEKGKQFLILPISEDKVYVREEYEQYLDDIDLDLLKSAEKKITEEISKYDDEHSFSLQLEDEKLYLVVEVIADIDPPVESEIGGGCGIDHEHKFLKERITE